MAWHDSHRLSPTPTPSPRRTLSANVNPKDGSGEIEFVDTATLDGELTATIPLGGEPKLTLKRAFKF